MAAPDSFSSAGTVAPTLKYPLRPVSCSCGPTRSSPCRRQWWVTECPRGAVWEQHDAALVNLKGAGGRGARMQKRPPKPAALSRLASVEVADIERASALRGWGERRLRMRRIAALTARHLGVRGRQS